MGINFPRLKQVNPGVAFRTEPILIASREIESSRSVVVGQSSSETGPKAAMLLGSVCELSSAKSRLNWGVWLDAEFPHVILIAGKRGSGKSYDLGIIAEGLCAKDKSMIARGTEDFAMILFDTQSQFWTLAEEGGIDKAQTKLIDKWNLTGNELKRPTVYRPKGTPIIGPLEIEFALRPSDLEASDWTALCELERFSAMGQCLYKARAAMPQVFGIDDMIEWLRSEEAANEHGEPTRDAVRWRLEAQASTSLFDKDAEDICARLGKPGAKGVVQLADLDEEIKAVIVAVVMRKLIHWAGPAQRRKKMALMRGENVHPDDDEVAPRIWSLIDEAHLICPSSGRTAARPVVVDYVKRGRDAGLSLVLATQQPSAIDTSAISQSDIVVIHKLTIDADINAATERMPSRSPKTVRRGSTGPNLGDVGELARDLASGQSLFADAESNRAFVLQSRPRITPHGGGEPEV